MDQLAILKHTGDIANLEKQLILKQRKEQEEEGKARIRDEKDDVDHINLRQDFFYNFDFLAQLFVG